jgi:SAM-dependent methyltransferase
MDVTNRFVLDFARRFAPGRILDYGCGAGAVVAAGRAAGLDIFGADLYYSGSTTREDARRAGLLGSAILEIRDGRLDFPDAHFALVTNNQVMEHIADLDAALREIHRVLKPGGTLLSIFPSRDNFREAHIGIPFAHRLPKASRLRFTCTLALRTLGLGTWKDQAPTRRQWTADKLAWIDAYTHYRPRCEIFAAFARYFTTELREPDYIRYRLRATPRLAPLARLLDLPLAPALASALFRKLAFLVLVSRKEPPCVSPT